MLKKITYRELSYTHYRELHSYVNSHTQRHLRDVVYEDNYGAIPDGYCVIHEDRDEHNYDPENLILVRRPSHTGSRPKVDYDHIVGLIKKGVNVKTLCYSFDVDQVTIRRIAKMHGLEVTPAPRETRLQLDGRTQNIIRNYSVRDAADLLKCSISSIYRLKRNGL
jgi:hypothetical protein